MDYGEVIANNLRAERTRKKLKRWQCAEVLGISNVQYYNLEQDASGIKFSYIIQLARLFDCNVNAFIINVKDIKKRER